MASPLSTLRKYQFAFFVVFGVVLMIVFVIDDPLNRWLSGAGRSEETRQTVVSWRGGSLSEAELGYEMGVRNVVREFLSRLGEETSKRKGFPRTRPLSMLPSEQEIVYTRILATKAEKMGLVVNDETIMQYLESLTADLIPRSEIGIIFDQSIGNRISEQQALTAIKHELLAQNYMAMTNPDPAGGQLLPAQAWRYYQRLHRRVKAEAIPLAVANYKGKVTKQVTDAEVTALYEQGKNRYPDELSPEPGFKRYRKAAFDYVRADRKKFEDEEFAKLRPQVTDPEITEYYEKNRDEFRVTEPPVDPAKPGAAPPGASEGAEKAAPPASAPAAPAATDPGKSEPSKSEPSKSEPSKSEPSKSEPSKSEPSKSEPSKSEPSKSEPAKSEPNAKEQSGAAKSSDATTVPPAATAPGATPSAPKPEQTDKKESPPTENGLESSGSCGEVQEGGDAAQPVAPPVAPSTDKPAPAAKADAAATPPTADSGKTGPAETPTKPADKSESAAKPSATSAEPPTEAAAQKPAAGVDSTKPKVEIKPLDDALREEIRDKVARQKASRAAQDRVEKAVEGIRLAIEKYSRQLRTAEIQGTSPPPAVDFEKLAAERGLEAGHVLLSDPIQIRQHELGKTFNFDFSSMRFERVPFEVLAYRDGMELYKPEEIRGESFIHFLYWKVKNEDPFVPELKDIRDEVVDAWKLREAVAIAQAEAKSLAEKARQSAKPLAEAFPDQPEWKAVETNEFTWMTTGSVAAGMGMPALSSVDGVEHAGQEFMRAVFALKLGEVGTAINQPHTTVYVVRIETESPSEEILRLMFLQTGTSMELQHVARMDRQEIRNGWLESIERDMEVHWVRQPHS